MDMHPYCEYFVFSEKLVDELAENMRVFGWKPNSVVTVYEGQVLDGRHRFLAAEKAGVEPVLYEFQGDDRAALRYVVQENLLTRHLTHQERKAILFKMRETGAWVKREKGEYDRREEANGTNDPFAPSQSDVADMLGVTQKTVKRWDAEQKGVIRASTSGNDEWYTPAKYIDMVREVMGEIDLDPASCDFAQETIQAKTFYTEEEDGLAHSWRGRVWLNPPYSKGLIDQFVEKVCDEYAVGEMDQAIVITHNFTDTAWFHRLASSASAFCFTRGRVKFYTKEGVGNSPTSGHCFFYFGSDVNRFAEVFGSIGLVCALLKSYEYSQNVRTK